MADNYTVIRERLETLKPFRGTSLSGDWEEVEGIRMFVVYSYRTPVANALGHDIVGQVNGAISDIQRSVTTSKHLNIIRKAWSRKG